MLWVSWYSDRQGVIRSDGISIIADFPRFLGFFCSYFNATLWRIVIPSLNPDAVNAHTGDPMVRIVSGTRPVTNLNPTALDKNHLSNLFVETFLQDRRKGARFVFSQSKHQVLRCFRDFTPINGYSRRRRRNEAEVRWMTHVSMSKWSLE